MSTRQWAPMPAIFLQRGDPFDSAARDHVSVAPSGRSTRPSLLQVIDERARVAAHLGLGSIGVAIVMKTNSVVEPLDVAGEHGRHLSLAGVILVN